MLRLIAMLAALSASSTSFASPLPQASRQPPQPSGRGEPTLAQAASSAWVDSTLEERNEIHSILQRHEAALRPLARHLQEWTAQLNAQVLADTSGTQRPDSPLRPLVAHLQQRITELDARTLTHLSAVLQRRPMRSAVAER